MYQCQEITCHKSSYLCHWWAVKEKIGPMSTNYLLCIFIFLSVMHVLNARYCYNIEKLLLCLHLIPTDFHFVLSDCFKISTKLYLICLVFNYRQFTENTAIIPTIRHVFSLQFMKHREPGGKNYTLSIFIWLIWFLMMPQMTWNFTLYVFILQMAIFVPMLRNCMWKVFIWLPVMPCPSRK